MTARARAPGGAAAPLLHWLVLLGGLALLATGRIIDGDAVAGTCLGAVFGTATGQLFAWLRLRVWTATVATLCLLSIGMIFIWNVRETSGPALETYLPAAACGYLSLTSRWSLAGFWFPAVPWSLAILEAEANETTGLGASWVLWMAVGAAFVVALWARETRRIAQWKTHAKVALAEPPSRVVLREEPLLAPTRGAWWVALGGTTICLTAWIAPHLRQWERGSDQRAASRPPVSQPASTSGGAAGEWLTCCPDAPPTQVTTRRVREYISPRAHTPVAVTPPGPTSCVACVGDMPVGAHGGSSQPASSPPSAFDSTDAPTPAAGAVAATEPPAPPRPPVSAMPVATTAAEGVRPAELTPNPPAPAPAPRPIARRAPRQPASSQSWSPESTDTMEEAEAAADGHPLLAALIALALAAVGANLVLRPVRRWIILRHLQRPWWEESVGQRVSNLWQLALVGLRDAGWHAGSSEAPEAIARRVDMEAMQVCAKVLERARHGVRVDAADLAAMEEAAGAAFAAARARAGGLARLVSWWRSPLP